MNGRISFEINIYVGEACPDVWGRLNGTTLMDVCE